MPVHTVVGSDAQSLADLVHSIEAAGESIVSVLSAGNCWAVVTRPQSKVVTGNPGPKPRKPITR